MSLRVHELAKELKLTSKELLDKLHALKIDTKSHTSALTDENVKAVKRSLEKASAPAKKEVEKKEPEKTGPATKNEAPSTASATSMIENAKRQLLAQKAVAKTQAVAQTTELRKPSSPAPSVLMVPAKPKTASIAEIKKPHRCMRRRLKHLLRPSMRHQWLRNPLCRPNPRNPKK